MSLRIAGLGIAQPEEYLSQEEAISVAGARLAGDDEAALARMRLLFSRAGVKRRRLVIVDGRNGHGPETPFFPEPQDASDCGPTTAARMRRYEVRALPLATDAVAAALRDAGWRASELTHLITVSCSGFTAPGVDVGLIDRLGMRATIERIHVGFMGCHGAINGLRAAAALANSDPDARIALCAVELCSLHFQYAVDPQRFIANALFSDGAAALVGDGSGNGAAGDRADGGWRVSATGSCVIPDSASAMSWRIGDHGFEMTLSRDTPALIRQRLHGWLVEWLASQSLYVGDIRSWAVHPGGPKILNAVEEALDLPRSATDISRAVLAECGNMSSATVLFILDRFIRDGAGGLPCVMLAFGPGLTAEAALVT